MERKNPCLTCGACCAHFLVTFRVSEMDPAQERSVPPEYAEPFDEERFCLLGTNQLAPRCAALQGEVGHKVRCGIYDRRPTPCRNFGVSWESGRITSSRTQIDKCNAVRKEWDLLPLTREAKP